MKRQEYISWDTYFMGIAQLSSKRSKDPKTQVGACIVSPENKIVGIGYNGFPKGISDDVFPWKDQGDFLETKYPYVVHAEANAILNASQNLKECKLFVTLFPCNECTKLIIQSGIKELIYVSNKDEGKDFQIASRKMLEKAQVKLRQISWESLNV
jgi:dCMP deaminase